jgi:hypothetical protein
MLTSHPLTPPLLLPSVRSGKRRRNAAAAAAAVPLLPDDALVDILSRVPGKSLCRFKCVSRAWRDLITDRLRCTRLPQTLEGFFINDDKMPSDDREDDDGSDRVVGRFINMVGRFMPLASFSFLGNQPGIQEFSLMGSCNGLLLFGHRRAGDTYDSLGYVVCNPATKQWVAVPSSGFKPLSLLDNEDFDPGSDIDPDIECAFTYLIFNPAVSSHFQLVEFISDDEACVEVVHVYSSETGAWCRTEWSSDEAISFFTESAFVSGMLHFSVTNFEAHREEVVAVDAKGDRCRIIAGPEKSCDVVFIGQSKGRLHYMSRRTDSTSQMTELSIWVLQEYNTEDWVLKHKVSFLHLFGRMSCQNQDYNVVTIHPDRDSIFFFQHWDLQLKSYDMDSKEVCALCTLGVGPQNIFPLVPYYAESLALGNKH